MNTNQNTNKEMSQTLKHCIDQFNFADPKWDDKNFPDYKEAKEEKTDSETNK